MCILLWPGKAPKRGAWSGIAFLSICVTFQKVIKEKKKNVHAFVEGYLVEAGNLNSLNADDWHRVVYDPYRWDTFMAEADGGELVTILEADGVYGEVSSGHPKMYAWGLTTDTR